MRRATASTWLLGLMVGFILIFVAYILMSINYSRTIRIKNDMISMIERYEGLNSTSLALVNNYLGSINHRVTGDCGSGSGFYGAPDLNSATLEPAQGGKKYFYCIKKFKGAGTSNYYQVTVFYRFNLPVVGAAGIFTVRGVTGNFQPFDDSAYAQATDGSYTSGIHSPSPGGGGFSPGGGGVSPGGGATVTPSNPTTTYTVSFDLNGGTSQKKNGGSTVISPISSQTVVYGNKATKPINPYKYNPNSTFMGWELNGAPYDFNTPVTSNITLTATWREKVEVHLVSDASCGSKAYRLDGGSSHALNGTQIVRLDYNFKLNLGNFKMYEGPNYGDNFANNSYDWVYDYGAAKPITRWVTLSGTTYDINTPLTDGMVLRAVCD